MPEWLAVSIPVFLAAVLAVLGALFLELRDHRDRLIRIESAWGSLPCVKGLVDCVPRS